MDILQETVAVYERLRKKRYRIIVDTGEDFTFTFQPANYHHLAGFQHLTDFRNISSPKSKDRFYGSVKRQQLQTEYIQRSSSYHEIEERLHTFGYLEDILAEGEEKIIVEYDRSKLSSEIEAKYYSPTWIDGKKHARNVYAHTREECEEKLKVLIAEMKAELAELKRQKADSH